jgi:hypothetical protein
MEGNPIFFDRWLVQIKVIICFYYYLAYKDETTITSVTGIMTASVIDLRPSPTTLSQRTETLHHQPYYKLGSRTLNKTNEHCHSLFNLLPTSLRPRQTSNKKGIDAVSIKKKKRKDPYCITLSLLAI